MAVNSTDNTIDITCGGGSLDLKIANPVTVLNNGDGTYSITQNDGTVAVIDTGDDYGVYMDTTDPCNHKLTDTDGNVIFTFKPEKSRYVSSPAIQSNTGFVDLKATPLGGTVFSPILSQVITNPSACCSLIMTINAQTYQFMSGTADSANRSSVNAAFSNWVDNGSGVLTPALLAFPKSLSPSSFSNKMYDTGTVVPIPSVVIPPAGSITIRSQSAVANTGNVSNKAEIDQWDEFEALSSIKLNAVGYTICP